MASLMVLVIWIRDLSNTYNTATKRYAVIYTTYDRWNRCTGNSAALVPTIRFGLPDTLRLQALCQLVGNFIHSGRMQTAASALEIKTTGMVMPPTWLNFQKAIKQRDVSVH
jgi:hypothetical protein